MGVAVGRRFCRLLFLLGGLLLRFDPRLLDAFGFLLGSFLLSGAFFADFLRLTFGHAVVAKAAAGRLDLTAGAAVRGTVLRVLLVGSAVVERVVEGGADADESEVRLLRLAVDGPVDAEDEAETDIQTEVRGTAGAEERQRDADDRADAQTHGDVDERLDGDHGRDAEADVLGGTDDSGLGVAQNAEDDEADERDGDDASKDAELFADDREDHVGLADGDGAGLGVRPFEEAFAEDAAVGERLEAQVLLVGGGRVFLRVDDDDEPLLLEVVELEPEQGDGGRREGEHTDDVLPFDARDEQHGKGDEQEDQCGTVIAGDGDEDERDERVQHEQCDVADTVQFIAHRIEMDGEGRDKEDLDQFGRLEEEEPEVDPGPGVGTVGGGFTEQ